MAVKESGWALKVYKHSLSLAFILLFLMSFALHAYGGAIETCEQNLQHGQAECLSTARYMTTSKFWFESFQNWQSEFLAVGSIVVLSIFLREKGRPNQNPSTRRTSRPAAHKLILLKPLTYIMGLWLGRLKRKTRHSSTLMTPYPQMCQLTFRPRSRLSAR